MAMGSVYGSLCWRVCSQSASDHKASSGWYTTEAVRGAVFHTEGVGVAFGKDIAVLDFDFVFVEGAGRQVGDK